MSKKPAMKRRRVLPAIFDVVVAPQTTVLLAHPNMPILASVRNRRDTAAYVRISARWEKPVLPKAVKPAISEPDGEEWDDR